MKPPAFGFGRVSLARATRHADALAARYLSALERAEVAALRIPKRRVERLAGRLAARRALRHAGVHSIALSIASVADGEAAGAPRILTEAGQALDIGLSISHAAGSAFAVACPEHDIGFDFERVEPREPAFIEDAFEPDALRTVGRLLGLRERSDLVVTVAWCAKEACMKLARTGMRAPLGAFAPLGAAWDGPSPPPSRTVRDGLRPALLVTAELGTLSAGIFARDGVAAVLVWRPVAR